MVAASLVFIVLPVVGLGCEWFLDELHCPITVSRDLWTVPSLHPCIQAGWQGWAGCVRGVFVAGLAAEYVQVPLGCCKQVPTHPPPRLSVPALPGGKLVLFIGQHAESLAGEEGGGTMPCRPATHFPGTARRAQITGQQGPMEAADVL